MLVFFAFISKWITMFMVIIIIINVKLIIITNIIGPSFITIFMFIIMKDRKHFL